MKQKQRANYREKCDRLFSKLVRERDGACVKCGSTMFLQCAHIISRSYGPIRTDPDNAIALCRGCHTFYTHRPLEWVAFIGELYPGRHDMLRGRAFGRTPDWKTRLTELTKGEL